MREFSTPVGLSPGTGSHLLCCGERNLDTQPGPQAGCCHTRARRLTWADEIDTIMTKPLQRYLGSGETLERLHEHARRLLRLQVAFEAMLPAGLRGACSVGNIKADLLVLLARNGAIATKLKQLAPSLQQQLGEQGIIVSAIQVKVQVNPGPPPAPEPQFRTIPQAGRSSIEALAASLPADAPLRAALERLAARSRTE